MKVNVSNYLMFFRNSREDMANLPILPSINVKTKEEKHYK